MVECRVHGCHQPSQRVCMTHMRVWARFWSKVDVRGPNECWPWRGYRMKKTSHGVFYISPKKKGIGAHRLSYRFFYGPPSGMVLHSCNHGWCQNPRHLYDGDYFDNARDSKTCGSNAHGETHGMAKLTEVEVIQIHTLAQRGYTQKWLAERFDVRVGTVRRIVQGRGWTHLNLGRVKHE